MASMRPSPAAVKPLTIARPLSDAINVTPNMASMKNSGERMDNTSGRTTGIARARAKAPNTAPTSELVRAAPRARPASPFFAMGWPSTMVAAVMPSPGMPNKMDVMSPVVAVTAEMPSRNAKASTACILKISGNIRARVTGPPSPGKMPTTKPMAIPMSIRLNVCQTKTCAKPPTKASSIA